MLVEKYPIEKLQETLVQDWHPYPNIDERDGWEALPDSIRKVYIARGEKSLDFDWPSLTATSFLDHVRTGNRTRFQAERNQRREAMDGLSRLVQSLLQKMWFMRQRMMG